MGLRGVVDRTAGTSYYEGQVRAVLRSLGVTVHSETGTDVLCYCPFHHNTDTPAFAVSKSNGRWICFRADCPGASGGSIEYLVIKLSGRSMLEASRFVEIKAEGAKPKLSDLIDETLVKKKVAHLPQMKIDELVANFWNNRDAQLYMRGRGFEKATVEEFEVGFDSGVMTRSGPVPMVVVPIHDSYGNILGVNGRGVEDKVFKLSRNIPRNEVLFNMNRAREYQTGILVESQFDAMKVWQAGFPNAVAPLGSHLSKTQLWLMRKYFTRLIVMTDNDDAGIEMGRRAAEYLKDVKVEWAAWSREEIYPHGAKDAVDMTDDEIRTCIKNSIPYLDL